MYLAISSAFPVVDNIVATDNSIDRELEESPVIQSLESIIKGYLGVI